MIWTNKEPEKNSRATLGTITSMSSSNITVLKNVSFLRMGHIEFFSEIKPPFIKIKIQIVRTMRMRLKMRTRKKNLKTNLMVK